MKKIKILSLLTIVIITGCGRQENQKENNPVPIVSTVTAAERTFSPVKTYSGSVKANKEAHLGATLPGKVERILYPLGSEVRQGMLLAELSGELLTQAEIEHQALQKDFDRVARLRDKGSISQMDYDHLKAKLEASAAKVAMMQKNTRVTAPFNGTIVEILVGEGENYSLLPEVDAKNLSLSNGIIHLMQLSPLKVTIDVNEKELGGIRIGQAAKISAEALPGKEFTGKVSYVKPFLSSVSRSAEVEIEVENPGRDLKPGMFAMVNISFPETSGIFVPIQSVFRQPGTGEDFVFTVEAGKARKIAVRQGGTIDGDVAVTGISAGTAVVISGKSRLMEGMPAEIKNN